MFYRRRPLAGLSLESARRSIWIEVDGVLYMLTFTRRVYILRDEEGQLLGVYSPALTLYTGQAWDIVRVAEFIREVNP